MFFKKILLSFVFIFGLSVYADSIIVDVGAKSNHLVDGDFNEDHNWYGIGYRFIEKDLYSVELKGVNFINSYDDPTRFYALTGLYTPIKYKSIKLGISGGIGYQKGYCVDFKGSHNCSENEKQNGSNEGILLLYSLYGELDNFIVNYTFIPNAVQAVSFGFKAVEW